MDRPINRRCVYSTCRHHQMYLALSQQPRRRSLCTRAARLMHAPRIHYISINSGRRRRTSDNTIQITGDADHAATTPPSATYVLGSRSVTFHIVPVFRPPHIHSISLFSPAALSMHTAALTRRQLHWTTSL